VTHFTWVAWSSLIRRAAAQLWIAPVVLAFVTELTLDWLVDTLAVHTVALIACALVVVVAAVGRMGTLTTNTYIVCARIVIAAVDGSEIAAAVHGT
jgi:hypothetical protein